MGVKTSTKKIYNAYSNLNSKNILPPGVNFNMLSIVKIQIIKEMKNAPSALLSYISTREKC